MDRKTITVFGICLLLLLGFNVAVNKLFPPVPVPPGSTNAAPALAASNSPAGSNTPGSVASTPSVPSTAPAWQPATPGSEQILEITNLQAHYTFTTAGGGLQMVELTQYPETIATRRERAGGTQNYATLNSQSPAPMLAVSGGPEIQGDGRFTLSPIPGGVRAEKTLSNGLAWTKDFVIESNYLVSATVRLENRSTNTLALPAQEWMVGIAAPMSSTDRGQYTLGMMWYNGEKAADTLGGSYFSPSGFMCTPRVPPAEFRAGATNVVWATAHNQFFALVAMPKSPADQVVMRPVKLPAPDAEELLKHPQAVRNPEGYLTSLVYPALSLAPGASLERQFEIYAGPKEYRTLAQIGSRLNNNLEAIMNFGWFGFFSKALLLAMNWLHAVLHLSYGWAIIAITVLIKIIFWPLTQASTKSMKRMQELGPQMKALQEKYKDEPQKLSQKQWEFWKKNKVNPMGGCLPMLVQIPVFFGLYGMIRTAIELRGAGFLWIADLSQPDTLGIIPGTGIPFNLLPLIYIASALWQSHLTPVSPGMDPAQQKMMRWMPLMFLAILYNFSSGLALYMTVQNLLTILQTKLINAKPSAPAAGAPAPALTPAPKKKK
ncbi:MAG: membrane protein insertase YidC [Verrucomicrobiota bacterium]